MLNFEQPVWPHPKHWGHDLNLHYLGMLFWLDAFYIGYSYANIAPPPHVASNIPGVNDLNKLETFTKYLIILSHRFLLLLKRF